MEGLPLAFGKSAAKSRASKPAIAPSPQAPANAKAADARAQTVTKNQEIAGARSDDDDEDDDDDEEAESFTPLEAGADVPMSHELLLRDHTKVVQSTSVPAHES